MFLWCVPGAFCGLSLGALAGVFGGPFSFLWVLWGGGPGAVPAGLPCPWPLSGPRAGRGRRPSAGWEARCAGGRGGGGGVLGGLVARLFGGGAAAGLGGAAGGAAAGRSWLAGAGGAGRGTLGCLCLLGGVLVLVFAFGLAAFGRGACCVLGFLLFVVGAWLRLARAPARGYRSPTVSCILLATHSESKVRAGSSYWILLGGVLPERNGLEIVLSYQLVGTTPLK
jgi:hypothetical protein